MSGVGYARPVENVSDCSDRIQCVQSQLRCRISSRLKLSAVGSAASRTLREARPASEVPGTRLMSCSSPTCEWPTKDSYEKVKRQGAADFVGGFGDADFEDSDCWYCAATDAMLICLVKHA